MKQLFFLLGIGLVSAGSVLIMKGVKKNEKLENMGDSSNRNGNISSGSDKPENNPVVLP